MNLYRVLIVDDDAAVRLSLKSLIAWNLHGYNLIGEASDGQQALEIIRNNQPDIIITDMKMPVMDGIELIRRIRSENLSCAILVLSSYNEFDLVKTALKLGAADYLLKLEMDANSLLQSLSDACNRLNYSNADHTSVKENMHMQQSTFFRNILSNFFSTNEEMQTSMQESGIVFNTDPVYCLMIKTINQYRFEEGTEEESEELRTNITNVIYEIAGDCFDAYCTEGNTGNFYLFISVRPEFYNEDVTDLIMNTAKRTQSMLWQYLNLECIIGIGCGNATLKGLRSACNRAFVAVRSKYYYNECQSIILYSDDMKTNAMDITAEERTEVFQTSQAMKKAIITLQQEELLSCIDTFSAFLTSHNYHRNYITYVLIELFICVQEALDWFGMPVQQTLSRSWRTYSEIIEITDSKNAQLWISDLSHDLIEQLGSTISAGNMHFVNDAKDYIDRNYSTSISLTELAAELHLNPSYLSTSMKKVIGMSYSEYLTHVRLEHAKSLLSESNDRISAIAEAVGYYDQYYFNRLFKRINKLTPGDYRKLIRGTVSKENT